MRKTAATFAARLVLSRAAVGLSTATSELRQAARPPRNHPPWHKLETARKDWV